MWRAIKVVSLASFLIGCENNDLSKMFFTKPVPAKQVTIVSNENANLGFPISVDILVVKDADLSPVLAEMDTKTWFSQKEYILPANLGNLEVQSFEIVAGNFEAPLIFSWSDRKEAKSIFVFAQYVNANVGKIRVDQLEAATIKLEHAKMSVANHIP